MITLNKKDDPELIKEEKDAKDDANKIAAVIKTLSYEEIRKLIEQGKFEKDNITIEKEQVIIEKNFYLNMKKIKSWLVCLIQTVVLELIQLLMKK